ncbi:MAG: YtxH domain-containing protein [Lacticaseibacillus songhuajiangensis]|jgi:gas vesicle protein|nr:YtxH domain-containing protein [Lacticaseibacillus songhuajiangensis]
MSKNSNFVWGFLLGTASALAANYLLAPANTKALKEKLESSGSELGDRAADYYEYAKDAATSLRGSAEELVTGLKTKLQGDDDLNLDDYDEETAELRSAVIESDDDEDNDDDDFDDIIVDGKSAFAQAKDEATPTAEDVKPEEAATSEETVAAEDDDADTEAENDEQ